MIGIESLVQEYRSCHLGNLVRCMSIAEPMFVEIIIGQFSVARTNVLSCEVSVTKLGLQEQAICHCKGLYTLTT